MKNDIKKRRILLLLIPFVILIAMICAFLMWGLFGSYKPSEEAYAVLNEIDPDIQNIYGRDYIAFVPEHYDKGLILYPGAKVDYRAYLPLIYEMAKQDVLCAVVHFPFDIAFFNPDACEDVMSDFQDVDSWYIAGHSLGGVVASDYLSNCPEKFDGLIFLASYSTKDLSAYDINVFSIIGTRDMVLNMEAYHESERYLPDDYFEYVIEGGNHGYFGSYGSQKGDGTADITEKQQRDMIVRCISDYMQSVY